MEIKMILKEICSKIISSDEFKDLNLKNPEAQSVEGISPASFPLIISSIFHAHNNQTFIITENIQQMNDLYLDLTCFIDEQHLYKFPPWETLPYEFMSPPESVERDRIKSIYKIISGTPIVIIATVDSVIRKIPAKNFFIKKGLTLIIDEEYPFDDIYQH